jgi:DegV family protein with EDD domain
MGSYCILTDTSAQFTKPAFAGRDLVRVIPLHACLSGKVIENDSLKISSFPIIADEKLKPHLIAPSVEEFQKIFTALTQSFDEIIVLLISSQLNDAFFNAEKAINLISGNSRIHLIDSLTLSAGLGMLTQQAVESASLQFPANEIEQHVRKLIPRIYSFFCTPSLSYLYHSGFIDQAQATVGEMLGLYPLYTLEEGKLSPVEKVRNFRTALEYFQEFLDEFDNLGHIALIQGGAQTSQETKLIRQYGEENFPGVSISEHPLNTSLATLFGPRFWGLTVIESVA